eukprot:1237931-Amphidinium_carterae.1
MSLEGREGLEGHCCRQGEPSWLQDSLLQFRDVPVSVRVYSGWTFAGLLNVLFKPEPVAKAYSSDDLS